MPLTLVFFVICLLCVQVYCPLHPECFINTFTSSTFYFSPPPWTQTTYHPTSLLSDPPAPTYPFNKKEKSLAENTARGKKSKGKVLLYCSVLKPHSSFSYFFLLVSFFSFSFFFSFSPSFLLLRTWKWNGHVFSASGKHDNVCWLRFTRRHKLCQTKPQRACM